MAITRWQPIKELESMRHQMSQLFDSLGSLVHPEREFDLFKLENALWTPAVELSETNGDIVLKVQVPGVAAKDLDVQVMEDVVAITGEHQEEHKEEKDDYFRSEFRYGKFRRVVSLPAIVNYEQVKHEFKDGVLTLTLPKVKNLPRKSLRVKLDAQESAREGITAERQSEEHLKDTLHTRTAEELASSNNSLQEKARESIVEESQKVEKMGDKMKARTATEVGAPA